MKEYRILNFHSFFTKYDLRNTTCEFVKVWIVLFVVWFSSHSILMATEVPISISSSVDRNKITIGDLITYSVTISHHPEVQVSLPGTGANLGGFEIREYKEHEVRKEAGMQVLQVDYIISTFFTGDFVIPPLMIGYTMPGDSAMQTLATEKIKIVVESMKASEAGDIRDVKAPQEIPRDWWYTLRYYVIGGMLLLVIGISIWMYRRHKRGESLLPIRQEPPRPPHEIALEALEALKQSSLLAEGKIKEYYIEVSDIIRRYIEGRYYVTAMEMTTYDVMQGLKSADINEASYEAFHSFLQQCDLVKFAKARPDQPVNEAILETAVQLVDATKVVIESVQESVVDAEGGADEAGDDKEKN